MALLPTILRRAPAIAAALLLGAVAGAAGAAAAPGTRRIHRLQAKMDFVRSMQEATRRDEMRHEVNSLRKAAQRRMDGRVLSKASPMPPLSREDDDGVPDFMSLDAAPTTTEKTLTGQMTMTKRRLNDEDDEEEEMDWENFGFDPSTYSVKYTGCTTIATYSDEAADDEDGDSVLAAQKFVIFRLCPSDYCDDDSEGGCDGDYGEYLIPLVDYLESYAQFREEQAEQYCEYCEQCMYYENYFYGGNNRELEDGDEDADDEEEEEEADDGNHACKYYSACVDYLYTCDYDQWAEENGYYNNNNGDDDNGNNNGNGDDDDEEMDLEQFFECAEYDYGNFVYYVGPMCGSDNDGSNAASTIKFGIFDDEYCTNYVGDKVDFFTITGLDAASEEAMLDQFSSRECVSCRESEQAYMIVKHDQDDADEISELCEELMTTSAKCNRRIYEAEEAKDDGYYRYQTYNQMMNEERTCSFIENIASGQYQDMEGYIDLDEDYAGTGAASSSLELFSSREIGNANAGQIFGMFFLGVACAFLSVWACFLHRGLRQQRVMNRRRLLIDIPDSAGLSPPSSFGGSPQLTATPGGASMLSPASGGGPISSTMKAIALKSREDSGVMANRSMDDSATEEDKGEWA